ncbi:MAG: GTP-binding protein [Hyphomicrobiales bacterium]|nr:MAG: GTP-binding protein [Hyphomicrobiales bacterium]
MAIPVTLLSGYLGAGKTTVINHLLSRPDGPPITVLVNDFGAINIDARLIADRGADTITLTNGCACCSIDDDLGSALQAQLARRDVTNRIVIEASGVAEPRRMAQSIAAWPGLQLASIVTVLDAANVRARAKDKFVGSLVQRQIEAADMLILNKIDLLDADRIGDVKGWLMRLAPRARTADATNGAVDPADVFSDADSHLEGSAPEQEADHGPHFHSTTLPLHAAVDVEGLKRILSRVPSAIHRVKGFVQDTRGRKLLVQCAGRQVRVEPYEARNEPLPMALVCIAADRSALDAFSRAIADWVLSSRPPSKNSVETAP